MDGGPDPRQYLSEIGKHLPFWDRRLDGVILTSPDSDALLGLIPVLERYRVDTVMTGAESGGDETYARWETLLAARPPETIRRLDPGTVWELEPGVTLEVLWPDSAETPGPLVLRLVHGETTLLLAANATTVGEEALAAHYGSALDSDVLQVPMNGAKTSCTPAFLQAVTPEVAVISAEADNWQGVPAPQTLARLRDATIYRTDRHGAVEVVSDGQTFWVEPEREGF